MELNIIKINWKPERKINTENNPQEAIKAFYEVLAKFQSELEEVESIEIIRDNSVE